MKSIQGKVRDAGIQDFIITVTAFAAKMMLFLEVQSFGFTIGIAFLPVHVIVLGNLIYKSGYFKQLLSGKAIFPPFPNVVLLARLEQGMKEMRI